MKIADDITNFYEKLIIEHFEDLKLIEQYDVDFIADLQCVVLNQLPPRYIRHQVDMVFYLPVTERIEMDINVKEETQKALAFMK